MTHPTAKVSEQVKRKCRIGIGIGSILQFLTPKLTLSPQTLHPKNFKIFIISCFVDHVTILFMLLRNI